VNVSEHEKTSIKNYGGEGKTMFRIRVNMKKQPSKILVNTKNQDQNFYLSLHVKKSGKIQRLG
jgi:hypothetical protein